MNKLILIYFALMGVSASGDIGDGDFSLHDYYVEIAHQNTFSG